MVTRSLVDRIELRITPMLPGSPASCCAATGIHNTADTTAAAATANFALLRHRTATMTDPVAATTMTAGAGPRCDCVTSVALTAAGTRYHGDLLTAAAIDARNTASGTTMYKGFHG